MKKKAQSISINTIVVAAIALIVLVLIVIIFTGNITGFRTKTNSCFASGGFCKSFPEEGGMSRSSNPDTLDVLCGDFASPNRNIQCPNVEGEDDLTKICCIGLE